MGDGAAVTHFGVCGACSTRQDLAVYMNHYDMTSVGKKCGIEAKILTAFGIRCFEELGMTKPCAKIWAYNAKYDGKACESICFREFFKAYNGPPPACALNDCL